MYAYLACLCAEDISTDTDEVADVEELLEYLVVHLLVLAGAYGVALDIDLYAAL